VPEKCVPMWMLAPLRGLLRLYPFLNGSGKIIDRTFIRNLAVDAQTLITRTRSGYPIRVFPNEMIGRNVYLAGRFDPTIAAVLRSFARPGDRLLDVGANIGVVSCELLHKVPKLAVLAVEPQPAVYELLRENLAQFGDRARCVCAAMSDRGGQARMQINSENLGGSCITDEQESTAQPADRVTVEMRTAPEILDEGEFDRLDMVKIDVEGHQCQVLTSLAPALDQYRPRVVLLEHDGALFDRSDPVRSCFDTLGYRIEGIAKRLNGWITITVDSPEARHRKFNDYIAVPA
jgi:FkbM family methyltransferase